MTRFGFKHPKPALNISQTFVTLHHLSRCCTGVGHRQQLAIEQFQVTFLVLVDGVTKQLLFYQSTFTFLLAPSVLALVLLTVIKEGVKTRESAIKI